MCHLKLFFSVTQRTVIPETKITMQNDFKHEAHCFPHTQNMQNIIMKSVFLKKIVWERAEEQSNNFLILDV